MQKVESEIFYTVKDQNEIRKRYFNLSFVLDDRMKFAKAGSTAARGFVYINVTKFDLETRNLLDSGRFSAFRSLQSSAAASCAINPPFTRTFNSAKCAS